MEDNRIKDLGLLVLAAGMGTRMKSALPKVLHRIAGRPLVGHVLKTAEAVRPAAAGVVVGHGAELVAEELGKAAEWGVKLAPEVLRQHELSGSGRAAFEALPFIKKFQEVIVLCGDAPLLRAETLSALLEQFRKSGASSTVLTACVPDPHGYGRIVKNKAGEVERIVEQSEADASIAAITEINSGMYVFKAAALAAALPQLKQKGPKKEYYLTDVLELIRSAGGKVTAHLAADYREILGINSRVQLAEAAAILRERILLKLMDSGVTVLDPATAYIDDTVAIGQDTVIQPSVSISGATVIGKNCVIGPNCFLNDAVLGDDTVVKFGSRIDGASAEPGCEIGPMAHLRPGAKLKDGAKVGNFSEVKKSVIGSHSKVNHLSYIGDATVGERVNIGAGTITCNYDGVKKHPTVLGDRVFVGSNVNLVAPVTVGAGAVIAAGSTITDDIPEGTLAIARERQVIKRLKQKA